MKVFKAGPLIGVSDFDDQVDQLRICTAYRQNKGGGLKKFYKYLNLSSFETLVSYIMDHKFRLIFFLKQHVGTILKLDESTTSSLCV